MLAEGDIGGIVLGYSHFAAMAGVLGTVIGVLWMKVWALQQELRDGDKAMIPVATKIAGVLDDHNTLDARRGALATAVEALLANPSTVACAADPVVLAKILKYCGEMHKDHAQDDPAHPGAKIWWSLSLPEVLRLVKLIELRTQERYGTHPDEGRS